MAKPTNEIGLTVKKEDDFSEWYTQLIVKAGLVEYTDVSGCLVFRPDSYSIWEKVQRYLDDGFKARGVKNSYFPMLIPEKYLTKEADHVEGFTPEVAWVTHSGNTELPEKLAIRPTSETIMYASYAKWIKSHRDLPLKLNQWCNVVRWEFSHPVPFIRTREFLWQEGHTAFATKEEADEEAHDISHFYAQTYKDMYALPVLEGRKSEKEKFAGAEYSLSCEVILPNGKACQGCTSHCLGQNFAKAFDISFTDADEQKKLPWQNSWGYTTRSIGIMIMMHSDDNGLVLPPPVAEHKVVIVPILFDKTKEQVLAKCRELQEELKEYNVILDDREGYSPGFKFNEWELKGIPIRIELGPKDCEKEHCVMVARDIKEKHFVKWTDLKDSVAQELKDMHQRLYDKAKKHLDASKIGVSSMEELKKAVDNKKWAVAPWCGSPECEENIKTHTGGAKTLNIPFEHNEVKCKCAFCDLPAKHIVRLGKSY